MNKAKSKPPDRSKLLRCHAVTNARCDSSSGTAKSIIELFDALVMPEQKPWHLVGIDAAIDALSSGPEGLSREDAKRRLQASGLNRLPEPPRRNRLLRFATHFHNILIYVLVGSALITASFGHLTDTFVILAVVFANAVIGFIQEGKAEKAMDAIRKMLALKASVLRDGERTAIPGEELVPGDLVLLEAGDKVPADLRLVRVSGLQIQEAVLTGESVPVEKHTGRWNATPRSVTAPAWPTAVLS